MEISSETAKKMIKAIECSQALEMPYREGKALLEHHGFDDSNRLEFPASSFVAGLQTEAINAYYTD